jgi:hypothetical protein
VDVNGASDWAARARREAAAIVVEAMHPRRDWPPLSYDTIIDLVALGWLQGANYTDHVRLNQVEDAFDELRAAL